MPWQIMPSQIWDSLNGDDPAKVKRATSGLANGKNRPG
jgi:hypothetical protein